MKSLITRVKSLIPPPLFLIAILAAILIAIACIFYPFSRVVKFMEDLGKVLVPPTIIIGAGWALFRFSFDWQAAIEIRLNASQEALTKDDNLYISAEVEINNQGLRNVRFPYDDSKPVRVYRVTFKDKGVQDFSLVNEIPVYLKSVPDAPAKATIVRARSTERLPLFIRVSKPGLYLLTFCIKLPESEEEIAKEAGARYWVRWSGATYVVVAATG